MARSAACPELAGGRSRRHKLSRQLSDHSSFLAPINCL
ncbi:lipid A hydroxylase LpxO, partial [Pseudomonas aeruginosa]|nr:lipid A hydroxylase LpxO [Pseudomonas aeruginosa]